MRYVAHRGKTTNALENTIEAFMEAAIDDHFDAIECDIHTTSDHEFIVFHDEDLKRLADDDRMLKDLSLKDIEKIKLTSNKSSFKIPHLIEFLNICKTYEKRPIIEIKKVHDISLLLNLLTLLEDYMDLDPMIISFNMNYLKYMRTLSPIELYIITTEVSGQLMYDCRVNEINFYINKESVSKQTVDVLRKKDFKIGVFTVNDKEHESLCESLNIDYLTTDNL